MRVLSLAGVQSLLAEQTRDVWVFGVVISKAAEDPKPYWVNRYVANTVGIKYATFDYTALPFEVTLAADTEDSPPQARLRIDNVALQLSIEIRNTHYPPDVELQLFRITPGENGAEQQVNLEMSAKFTLLSATANALTVEGILGYRNDFLNEPAMHTRFTPMLCPALFRSTESTGQA